MHDVARPTASIEAEAEVSRSAALPMHGVAGP
jgi:hypothetical protein